MSVKGLKNVPVAKGIKYNLHINCNLDITIKFGWPLPFSKHLLSPTDIKILLKRLPKPLTLCY